MATEVRIDQAILDLLDGRYEAGVAESFLVGPAMEPFGLEDTHGVEQSIALSAIYYIIPLAALRVGARQLKRGTSNAVRALFSRPRVGT